jgi:hypothetical protein
VTSLHVTAAGQYAESTSAPNVGPAFTLAIWYRPTTLDAGTALGLGSSGTSQYAALGMQATGQGFFEISGGGTADAFSASNFSDGNWHHLAGVANSNSSRVFYGDGVAGTVNTTVITPSGAARDRVTVGALRSNGSLISTAQGDLAYAAIWSIALTSGEVASLAGGALPSAVQSGSLVFYSVLDAVASPEEETIAGRDLAWGAGAAAPTQSASNPPVGSAPISLTEATETDTAVALTAQKVAALTAATETDGAQALVWQYLKTLVPATEADEAVGISFTGGTAPRASQRVGWGVGVRSPGAETILAR